MLICAAGCETDPEDLRERVLMGKKLTGLQDSLCLNEAGDFVGPTLTENCPRNGCALSDLPNASIAWWTKLSASNNLDKVTHVSSNSKAACVDRMGRAFSITRAPLNYVQFMFTRAILQSGTW